MAKHSDRMECLPHFLFVRTENYNSGQQLFLHLTNRCSPSSLVSSSLLFSHLLRRESSSFSINIRHWPFAIVRFNFRHENSHFSGPASFVHSKIIGFPSSAQSFRLALLRECDEVANFPFDFSLRNNFNRNSVRKYFPHTSISRRPKPFNIFIVYDKNLCRWIYGFTNYNNRVEFVRWEIVMMTIRLDVIWHMLDTCVCVCLA